MNRIHTALAAAVICLAAASACSRHKKQVQAGPPPAYAGSYIKSCRDVTTLPAGFFSAECADGRGQFQLSYLQGAACHGDIGNSDGLLVCNGAKATRTAPKPIPLAEAASDQPASGPPASGAPAAP